MAVIVRRLNPLVGPLARRLPPLAILRHKGRRTGRSYDTPVQAFLTPRGYLVGLAYDHNAPWALNLLAADGGEMIRAGRRYRIIHPRRVGREARELLSPAASLLTGAASIDDFLQFDAEPLQG